MTEHLTWNRAKDGIVLVVASGLLTVLGILAKGQADANAALGEVRRDVAVILAEKQRDREEVQDLKERVRLLESRR